MTQSPFNTRFDKNRLRLIKMIFPLNKEALTSYLSPILGQFAIKNSEFIQAFIDAFNKSTNNVLKDELSIENVEVGGSLSNEEVFIPLIINVYKGGKFIITTKSIQVGKLFSQGMKKKRRFLRYITDTSGRKTPYLFRNIKKLIQVTMFKLRSTNPTSLEFALTYKSVRNSLFKTT